MENSARTMQQPINTAERFTQQWPHLRQQVKAWWDRLTDADLEQVAGNKEQLIRIIQARYGYAWERAEQEVDRRLAEGATSTAREFASDLAKTVGEAGTTAQKMATTAASAVADTMGRAGDFLPEFSSGLIGLIRRYPVPSLLVGMGVGFLVGRSLAKPWAAFGDEASRHQSQAGFPDAVIQCTRCGQMVRQADMVSHSTTCSGTGLPGHGGSPA